MIIQLILCSFGRICPPNHLRVNTTGISDIYDKAKLCRQIYKMIRITLPVSESGEMRTKRQQTLLKKDALNLAQWFTTQVGCVQFRQRRRIIFRKHTVK